MMKVVYKLSSPNYRQKLSTIRIMQDLMIAVCGLAIFTVIMQFVNNGSDYGIKALLIYAAAAVTGVVTDAICGKILKRKDDGPNKYLNTVLSPVVTSVIFALTIPVGTPIYVVVIGVVIAIVFGKALYGGFGSNVFNPALVGRVVVHLSFSSKLVSYLGDGTDLVSTATPTTALAGTNWVGTISTSLSDLWLGNYSGALGETCTIVILIIGVILAYRKVLDWRIPVYYLGTAFILAFVSGIVIGTNPLTNDLTQIALGGLAFGAVFMATDPVTSPTSPLGKIIYGIMLGILTMLIRLKANYPEGVLFSILIMNMFTPFIDNITLGRTDQKIGKQIGIIVACLALGIGIIGGVSTTLEDTEAEEVEETTNSGATEDEDSDYPYIVSVEDNVYTVETEGFSSSTPLIVEVVLNEETSTVESVTVIDYSGETDGYGKALIEGTSEDETAIAFYNQVLNGTMSFSDVDGVDVSTGATYTASGIIEAIQEAIDNLD